MSAVTRGPMPLPAPASPDEFPQGVAWVEGLPKYSKYILKLLEDCVGKGCSKNIQAYRSTFKVAQSTTGVSATRRLVPLVANSELVKYLKLLPMVIPTISL